MIANATQAVRIEIIGRSSRDDCLCSSTGWLSRALGRSRRDGSSNLLRGASRLLLDPVAFGVLLLFLLRIDVIPLSVFFDKAADEDPTPTLPFRTEPSLT